MRFNVILRLLIIALLLAVSSVNAGSATAANPNFAKTIALSPKDAAVLFTLYFHADDIFGKQSQHRRQEPTFWTPTAAEIAQAQAGMGAYVRASAFNPSWNRFGYKPANVFLTSDFQQCGGVMQGDRKYVFINGFTASEAPDFVFTLGGLDAGNVRASRSGFYSDGGSPFRAAYDLVSHRIVYLVSDRFVETIENRAVG